LDELLEEDGRLDASRALPIFTQVAAGLAHAHGKGIIHRDIKPSNIMLVDNEGRKDFVKIVDFGIAKMLNPPTEELKNLTQTGEIYGSPLYMSPEQFRGLKLDPRTDIYSFGAVMYRTLTGQQMFDHNDQLQLMYKQVTELPPKFAEAAPGVKISAELESIVFKCLAKERDARFQSMHELASALEQITLETEKPANTVRLQSAGQDVLPSSSGDQSADAQQCAVPAISHGNAPVAPAGQLREQAIGAIPFVEVEEDTGNTTQGSGETTKTVVCEPLPVDKKYELKPEGKKEDTISIVLPRQAIWSTLVAVAVIIGSLCVLYFIMSPAPTTQQANSPLKKDVPPSAAGQREKGAVVKQEKFPAIETKGQKPKVADLGAMSGPVVTAGSKKHTQAVKKPRRPSRAPQAVTSTNWQTRYYTSRPATPYVTPAAAPSYSSTYTSTRQIPPDNEPTMPSPAVASPYHSNSPAEPASSSYYSSRLGERLPNGRVNFGQLKKQFRGKVGRLKNSIGRIIDRL
ncbi:MAG TPA: serine/threonine-protein kinase, partial [Candidatus Obscuribacterales bacterium]